MMITVIDVKSIKCLLFRSIDMKTVVEVMMLLPVMSLEIIFSFSDVMAVIVHTYIFIQLP